MESLSVQELHYMNNATLFISQIEELLTNDNIISIKRIGTSYKNRIPFLITLIDGIEIKIKVYRKRKNERYMDDIGS